MILKVMFYLAFYNIKIGLVRFLWYVLYTQCAGDEIYVMCVHSTHLPYLCDHSMKKVLRTCVLVAALLECLFL